MTAAQELELIVRSPDGAIARRVALPLGARLVLGRGDEVDVPLPDEQASRQHLALARTAQGVFVKDLGSRNGTFLAEERLPAQQARLLAPGALLRVGACTIGLAPAPAPGSPGAGEGAPSLAASGAQLRVQDEFERLGELGQGAHGAVFAARHRASGQHVAIKVLHTAQGLSPTVRERFLREARVRIDCPQVVQVHDLRVEGEQVLLIMELVAGCSAQDLLQAGPLPLSEALHIGEQVALGLAAAHEVGLVHRDVKPANILVTQDGRVKLGDFGIAKELGSRLTNTGQGIGSLDYVAPEQAEDAKRVEAAADLYALGATLYHLIAGRPPFDSRAPDFFERLFEEDPPPLERLRPDCPTAVSRLVLRLLEKDPEDRGANARTLAKLLGQQRAALPPSS